MDNSDRHKHSDAHPAELSTTEARQASARPMSFRVLIISTLLVIAAGLALGAYYYVPADNKPAMETAPPQK